MKLTTAQIGRCGELMVQLRLLLLGVESAPMSTDVGIDLVAYASRIAEAKTIQVKANLKPKPGGGKGKSSVDWWIPLDCPAEYVALVDLSTQRVWIFQREELPSLAQQSSGDKFHLYMYTDPTAQPTKTSRLSHAYEFERFLLENRAHKLFGIS